VVLAAGRGSRLGELTSARPKCLLEVGGRTILDRTLDAFACAGLTKPIIVAGYQAEAIRTAVSERDGPPAFVVTNPDWSTTGTAASLAVGLAAVEQTDRVVIVEGDVVFDPELLKLLLRGPDNATLGSPWTPDLTGSMLVTDTDQRAVGWIHADDGKARPAEEDALFKSVNITLLTRQFAHTELLPILRTSVSTRENASLEWSLSKAVQASPAKLAVLSVTAESWCEVDDAHDLAVARKRFTIPA
jgi:choline kinase